MSIRLAIDYCALVPSVRILGHPRGVLVLVQGDGGRIGVRWSRELTDWRRHFRIVRDDVAAVHDVLTGLGVQMTQPGAWTRVVEIAGGQGHGEEAAVGRAGEPETQSFPAARVALRAHDA